MSTRRYNVGAIALLVVVLLSCASVAFAQRYVDVPAGYGTLQAVIRADSANRVADPNTVYRVHRGTADSVYYLTSTLQNWGAMPLRIESVGSGALPPFVLATLSDGSAISPMISARANFALKGVYLNGVNTLGTIVDRVIRIQASPVRVDIDSCVVNMSSQSFIRVDNTNARIFLKDTRVTNIYSDWANARVVDNRGITIDTLSMIGCSVSRIAFRVYREGGGILTYGYFNHNTFTEVADAVLSLGSTKNVVYINNLAVNCGFLGKGKSSANRLLSMTPLPSGQSAYVANNVFYSDSAALAAAYKSVSDTIVAMPYFADTLVTFMNSAGTTNSNMTSPVTFTMPANNVTKAIKLDSIAKWYWKNPGTLDASILKVDSIKFLNLGYNTSAPAYKWGADGKPAGATNWFGIVVGVEKPTGAAMPSTYLLSQNYPNPFNPSTAISFQLPAVSSVSLKVFDLLGREIATVVAGTLSAGTHTVQWDASLQASGVYLYRLDVNGVSQTRKMVLTK